MKKGIIAIICIGFSLHLYAQQSNPAKNIKPAQLERKIAKNIQLIDVRTAKEFKEGHIANAINIDVNSPDFEANVLKLQKNKRVYVYCRTGRKSIMASKKLDSLGFSKLYNLTTGFEGWNKEKKKSDLK